MLGIIKPFTSVAFLLSPPGLAKLFSKQIQKKINELDSDDLGFLVTLFVEDLGECPKQFRAMILEKTRGILLKND
jgi:hypothetical protein